MKTILITGATGAQGGSVAQHLLQNNNQFKVKCLTRNSQSDEAKQLADLGAEIVQGDLSDKASLVNALNGCQLVFGVTNFWEHFDKELQQGKNLIDAVAESGIEHFVLSTLPSSEKLSEGALTVPHFETKALMEEYCKTKTGLPYTFLHPAFYFENFLSFFPPQSTGNGSFGFGFPQGDTPLAGIAIEDLGGIVKAIFNQPEVYIGKTIGAVSEDMPCDDYAFQMSEILGIKIVYNDIPRDVFSSFGFPGAEDLANMFTLNKLYIPNRQKEKTESHQLYSQLKSFSQWLKENKSKFNSIILEPSN
ncbi:NmrA/HSCARG family protein [Gaetbulibacter sp. M235]|uniref:NmrA/HSCARG family protein n=1 Tax=Gaetbulibacter sp. M235 TaxID=3126510 RepID=UPI00374F9CBD